MRVVCVSAEMSLDAPRDAWDVRPQAIGKYFFATAIRRLYDFLFHFESFQRATQSLRTGMKLRFR